MYIPRNAETTLASLSSGFPVVAVTGPRQSGKSTLVRHVFPDKPYITLEDLDTRSFAQEDPRGFLSSYPDGAILDEVQRVPHLFSYLQSIVDHDTRMGLFVLTGSQQFGLVSEIAQSLAGRVAFVRLLPFSISELASAHQLPERYEDVLYQGFYPPIYDRAVSPTVWLENYVRTYVERDVRQLIQVRDLSAFQTFVRLCAAHTGQLLNLSSLANDCGVTHNTAKAWISILEASFILTLLPPHHETFNKRLIKTPKLYFYDPGLAAYLLGIQQPDHMAHHPQRGALFESLVVTDVMKTAWNRAREAPLSFWRDRTGNELDLVIESRGRLSPVEIKSSRTINSGYFRFLLKWSQWAGERAGDAYLVYGGEQEQHRQAGHVLPWFRAGEVLGEK